MIRNRNGYFMDRRIALNLQQFAEGADGAAEGLADAGAGAGAPDAGNAPEGAQDAGNGDAAQGAEALSAEIARLTAEMAKQKAALDKSTREAADYKRQLRAQMTAEQIAAKEKEDADEAQRQRIIELEKTVARVGTVKTVMSKLGLDEDAAGNLADSLYGAADVENALLEIQKAWQAREKALRIEFGRIPGPGAGADSNSPEAQAVARATQFGKEQNARNEQARKAMEAYLR